MSSVSALVCTLVIAAGAWVAFNQFSGVTAKSSTEKYDPTTGLGRGAPGFRMSLTNAQRPMCGALPCLQI